MRLKIHAVRKEGNDYRLLCIRRLLYTVSRSCCYLPLLCRSGYLRKSTIVEYCIVVAVDRAFAYSRQLWRFHGYIPAPMQRSKVEMAHQAYASPIPVRRSHKFKPDVDPPPTPALTLLILSSRQSGRLQVIWFTITRICEAPKTRSK